MRIAVFPAQDERAASARIRSFTLARQLRALGHDVQLSDERGAEVIFVQKRARASTIAMLSREKQRGARIIYDFDDMGAPLWYSIAPHVLRRMLSIADVVTTDTDAHRDLIERDLGISGVAVVPDAIDYNPEGPVRLPLDEGPLRVLWFGHVGNLHLFERYASVLLAMRDVQVVVSTNPGAIEQLRGRFPSVVFEPWSAESFVRVLQSCALSLLPHDGSEADRAKSNNRMITSITWGVPALVSRTPEYERTAKEAGVPYAVFDDPASLQHAVENLRSSQSRRQYLDAAQPDVWRRYAPSAVAHQFIDIVGRSTSVVQRRGYIAWLRKAAAGNLRGAFAAEVRYYAATPKYWFTDPRTVA